MEDAAKWNRRASFWKKERINKHKSDARVVKAMAFLGQHGALQPNYEIADIGCGPGRFAVAFAKEVHAVTGFDFSERMIEQGRELAESNGITNVQFETVDFHTLDIIKKGYQSHFDLVFCSLSQAIQGFLNLKKVMDMSRRYCCVITHTGGSNSLRERIMRDLFGREMTQPWNTAYSESLLFILHQMGYTPITQLEKQHKDIREHVDSEYVEFLMGHLLTQEECTPENADRVLHYLMENADADGCILESSDMEYEEILWDISVAGNKKHIFLTGSKQTGKTTIMNSWMHSVTGKIGGFRTTRTNSCLKGQYSVHLLRPDREELPCTENLLFLCGEEKKAITDRFNDMGCRALITKEKAEIILMDELGPHEEEALLFCNTVFEVLDGETPVYGVLQEADSAFLSQIINRSDVQMFLITEENRGYFLNI